MRVKAGAAVSAAFKSFRRDQRGTTLVFFAIGIVPAFAAIGTAIDITQLMMLRSNLTAAVDAAALAGGRVYFSSNRQRDIEAYFNANIPSSSFGATFQGPYAQENDDKGTLRVWASATMPTGFMKLVGVDDITITTESVVARQTALLDVVLALDLSGSMLGSVPGEVRKRVDAAKSAAEDLVNIIYGDPASDLVRVGIVPWGGKVNVSDFGTTHGFDSFGNVLSEPVGNGTVANRYRAVSLGAQQDNPFQKEHYTFSYIPAGTNSPDVGVANDPVNALNSAARDRFVLPDGHEDRISKVYYAHNSAVPLLAPPPQNWKGCVYARWASTARPFAWNQAAGSYDLSDDKNNAADLEDGIVTSYGPDNVDWVGWMPMGEEGEPQAGSNRCDLSRLNNHSSECTPCLESGVHRLKKSKGDAITVLRALEAESSVYTNIPQGLVWAWRLLSDDAPFTEGGENSQLYAGYEKERAIVLLTDGANTTRPGDAYNRALNTRSERDQRLKDLAQKIKDSETLIYTVQFANGDGDLASLMKTVATKPDAPYYNYAPSSEQLTQSFRAVANNLANLRLAK
ncbi:MAG: pilus assembly protein TadG-related protein [Pseudomonadota bacterium]